MIEENENAGYQGEQKTEANNLGKSGWSAIEEYLWNHDASTMKVFSEDIDNLLIFAGLFSAVLTAFVVQSYPSLQPDNSQLAVDLLTRISSQLEASPLSMNYTASPTVSLSNTFRVSASMRWINALWFLSLIFSLASALFGIFVKQWIREYLQWNQPAAPPRENVLVRQLRSEAWDDWNVSVGIAAIPALLQLGVVLFVLGLIVLLWTLDPIVATIATTAAALLLIIAFTVTILPAFSHRCPYKSPTGWACVIMVNATIRLLQRTSHLICGYFRRCIEYVRQVVTIHCPRIIKRLSDIISPSLHSLSSRISRVYGNLVHERGWISLWLYYVFVWPFRLIWRLSKSVVNDRATPSFSGWRQRDLCVDLLKPGEISDIADILDPSFEEEVYALEDDGLSRNICQVIPLVRALSWVRKGSDDSGLLMNIGECVQSLHLDATASITRFYTYIYTLRKLSSIQRRLEPYAPFMEGLRTRLYRTVNVSHRLIGKTPSDILKAYIPVGKFCAQTGDFLEPSKYQLDSASAWVLSQLLFADVQAYIESILMRWDDSSFESLGGPCRAFNEEAEIPITLLCLLIQSDISEPSDSLQTRICVRLVEAYNSMATSSYHTLRTTGMQAIIWELALGRKYGKLCVVEGTNDLRVDDMRALSTSRFYEHIAYLAMQIYDQNPSYTDQEDCHRFVLLTDFVIRSLHLDFLPFWRDIPLGRLLEKMTEATKKSVGKFTNCGCYCDLPWIYTLAHSESFSRLPPQQVYTLISALEESIREGIITGEQVKKEFTQLKARVAESQITRHVDETSRLPVVGTGIDRAMDNLETSSNWT